MTITGDAIVAEIEKFKGFPYVYGAEGPKAFDCSGLVQYALTQLGVNGVPRTSEAQYAWATKIDKSQLQSGDLIFAQFPGDNASPGHVGVYIGNGQVLSAEDPAQGVGVDSLANWGSAIVGYGRVPDSSGGTDATTTAQTAGLFSWPGEITGFFGDSKTLVDSLLWLVNPASWMRIGSFAVGTILVLLAVYVFTQVNSGESLGAPIERLLGSAAGMAMSIK
jgi:hypothetical protein